MNKTLALFLSVFLLVSSAGHAQTVTPGFGTGSGSYAAGSNTLTLEDANLSFTFGGNPWSIGASGTLTITANFANPTGTAGLSAVNGTAKTFMRSDAAPPLSQAIVPTWTGAHIHDNTLTVNNVQGATADLLVKGDTLAGLLFADVSTERVGVGTAAPEARLHVSGGDVLMDNAQGVRFKNSAGTAKSAISWGGTDILFFNASSGGAATVQFYTNGATTLELDNGASYFTGAVTINDAGAATADVRIEGDTDANVLFVDASVDQVAVKHNAPAYGLDVDDTTAVNELVLIPTASPGDAQVEGAVWASIPRLALQMYAAGITQTIPGVVQSDTADTNVVNTVTETALFTCALPANFLGVGKGLYCNLAGTYSTKAPAAGTLLIKSYLGATAIGSSTMTVGASQTNKGWAFENMVTCRSVGGSGTVFSQGSARFNSTGSPWGGYYENTGTTTIDTTAAQTFSVKVTWSTADTSNSITKTSGILRAE